KRSAADEFKILHRFGSIKCNILKIMKIHSKQYSQRIIVSERYHGFIEIIRPTAHAINRPQNRNIAEKSNRNGSNSLNYVKILEKLQKDAYFTNVIRPVYCLREKVFLVSIGNRRPASHANIHIAFVSNNFQPRLVCSEKTQYFCGTICGAVVYEYDLPIFDRTIQKINGSCQERFDQQFFIIAPYQKRYAAIELAKRDMFRQ